MSRLSPVQARVREIVSEAIKAPIERIELDTDLRQELHVDSLLGLQIVAAIENEFGVMVPEDEIDDYSTVRVIAAMVEKLRRA
jgi:acyl carrier protein